MRLKWPSVSQHSIGIVSAFILLDAALFGFSYKMSEALIHSNPQTSNQFTHAAVQLFELSDELTPILTHRFSYERFVQLARAFSYANLQQYSQANYQLSCAIASDNSNSALYFLRGMNYQSWMKLKSAADDFEVSASLNPNGRKTEAYALGKACVEYLDATRKKLAGVEKVRPNNSFEKKAPEHVVRAILCILLEKYDMAIAECNTALKFDDRYASAYSTRASAYSYLGNYDKAIADCTNAINIEPISPGYYRERAQIYRWMQRPDLALFDDEQEIGCLKRLEEEDAVRAKVSEEKRQNDLRLAYLKIHKNDPEALDALRKISTNDKH